MRFAGLKIKKIVFRRKMSKMIIAANEIYSNIISKNEKFEFSEVLQNVVKCQFKNFHTQHFYPK